MEVGGVLAATMRESTRRRPVTAPLCALLLALLVGRNGARADPVVRFLEEAAAAADDDAAAVATDDASAAFAYDLSAYSVRFEKCQYVKAFDDELAQDANSETPLALQHFVIFRLCPTDSCGACDAEDTPYGKYALEVGTYLDAMVRYQREALEKMCDSCGQNCNNDNNNNQDGDDASQMSSECTACSTTCDWYDNLGANGYVDASDFIECQALDVADNNAEGEADAADDGQVQYYTGPRCNAKGKIVIGLFSDEKCREPVDGQSVESLLGAKLSYHLLNNTYSDDGACVSCKEAQDGDGNQGDDGAGGMDQNDAQDSDDVNEMCENLYQGAAKCESKTGITVGFVQTSRDNDNDGEQENQVENEFLACTFIDSLIWNSYTETGEINTKEKQDVIIRKVTKNQAIALSMVTLSLVLLAGGAYYLDRKIRAIEAGHPSIFRGEHKFT